MRQRAPTRLCSRRRVAAAQRPCQPLCSCLAALPELLSSLNLTPLLPSALLKSKPLKFCADPHGLVGKRVNIIQEDDSTVEGMIVDWNPSDQTHVVLVGMGTADEACEPLPLVEYPDAYQVRVCVCFGQWGRCFARGMHAAGCAVLGVSSVERGVDQGPQGKAESGAVITDSAAALQLLTGSERGAVRSVVLRSSHALRASGLPACRTWGLTPSTCHPSKQCPPCRPLRRDRAPATGAAQLRCGRAAASRRHQARRGRSLGQRRRCGRVARAAAGWRGSARRRSTRCVWCCVGGGDTVAGGPCVA